MGNFPTAAKLKPPKQNKEGKFTPWMSLSLMHTTERGRGREMTVIHTQLQAAPTTQILTCDVHHVVQSVWFMQRSGQLPHLSHTGPEEEEHYLLVAMAPLLCHNHTHPDPHVAVMSALFIYFLSKMRIKF